MTSSLKYCKLHRNVDFSMSGARFERPSQDAFTRVYYTEHLTVWRSFALAVKWAHGASCTSNSADDSGSGAGRLCAVWPCRRRHGGGRGHHHLLPWVFWETWSQAWQLHWQYWKASDWRCSGRERARERQKEREKVEYGQREWNKQSNCQVSRKIAPTLLKDTAHLLTALLLYFSSPFLLSCCFVSFFVLIYLNVCTNMQNRWDWDKLSHHMPGIRSQGRFLYKKPLGQVVTLHIAQWNQPKSCKTWNIKLNCFILWTSC